MDNFPLIQGTALPLAVNLVDNQGAAQLGFSGTEGLDALVWPGGNRAEAFAVDSAWSDPAAGLVRLEVGADQSAALAPGRYQGACLLDHPEFGWITCYRWSIEVLPAAGPAVQPDPDAPPPPPLYCTLADVLAGRPWLRKLQDDDDAGGFAGEIARASRWLDELAIMRAPRSLAGRTIGSPGAGAYASGPSPYLRKLLDGGALVVRDWVRDCVAMRAAALVCEGQLGPGSDSSYQDLGRRLMSGSYNLANSRAVELRTGGPNSPPSLRWAIGSGSLR